MTRLPSKRFTCLKVTALLALIAVGHVLQSHPMDDRKAMIETPVPLTGLG